MTEYIAVQVDDEFPAEEWWAALRERFPRFAKSLERNGAAIISRHLWDELEGLPGFTAEGKGETLQALIDYGSEGEAFNSITAEKHTWFSGLY